MADISDVVSFTDAAEEKNCSRTTLYRAVDDGRLNDVEVGGRRMLIKDEAWKEFEPVLIGSRVRKVNERGSERK